MKISVCMATFNGGKFIREQVMSILPQLGEDDEIIVSDDGSSDETINILNSFQDRRIKVIANKGRHGIVPNFENALKNSCGDYIFFSDQDDIWNINKVNTCILALKDADLVVHNSRILFERNCSKELDFFQWRHSGPGYWKNLYKNTFVGSCMAFRKEVKGYALPFPKHILWHDMWIGLITEKHGVTKFINDQLLYYRRHDGNASTTCSSSSFSRWTQLKYRIQMFYYTLNR